MVDVPESLVPAGLRAVLPSVALAAAVGLGVGVLQTDHWRPGPPIDLLARAPDRALGPSERVDGHLVLTADPTGCPTERDVACPELLQEWDVPVRTPFAALSTRVSGDMRAVDRRWVRVRGVYSRSASAGEVPRGGTGIVPVGEDPVRVQVRAREARGTLVVERLVLVPLEERRRARVLRGATLLGWFGLGAMAVRHVARASAHPRRGVLAALLLAVVWLGLSAPSIEWIDHQLDPPRHPVSTAPLEPSPRPVPHVPRADDDGLPLDPFSVLHGIGFLGLGGLLVAARGPWVPAVLLAPGSELVQSVLPGRTGRLEDVAWDLGGLGAGALLMGAARVAWKRVRGTP